MRVPATLLAGLLMLAGCAKKEAPPAPDPVAEATLARTLTFPTAPNLSNDTTYVATAMLGGASLSAAELVISIGPKVGRDGIRFQIPKTALTTVWVGSYLLLDQANSLGTVAKVGYDFTPNHDLSKGHWLIYGETNAVRGQVRITAYDASRQLLSGSYEMAIDNMQNLLDMRSVPSALPLCNLRVSGTFTNLKVQ